MIDHTDQREHFELERHQYPSRHILNPPRHTALELAGILDRLAAVPPGARVLDFGAGTGRLSIALAQAGYHVLAMDISESSLAVLQQTAATLGLGSIATTTTLPDQGEFAAVVGADVLHHVDLGEYLPQLRSVLAGGGKAVFSEPGGMNPAWYAFLTLAYDIRVERRIIHSTLRTLPRAFHQAGFESVSVTGVGLLPRPVFGWSERACRLHDRAGNLPLLRWLAYRYVIDATA